MGPPRTTTGPGGSPDPVANAVANADHAVHDALSQAQPYADALRPALDGLFSTPRPPADLYNPRGTPTDQLGHMNRAILFRPGMAHEVAAMGRGHGEGGNATADDAIRVIRDGRMITVPSRRGEGAEGSEGARRAGTSHPAAAAREAAAQLRAAMGEALSTEELNLFERIFMAHFEGGIPLGEQLAGGQFKFLGKSEKAWMEFFHRFGPFTFQKKTSQGDVQFLVFRGLFKDQQQAKSGQKQETAAGLFLVSDMKFVDGKTDKFARLMIQSQGLADTMAEHQPGDVLGKELLAQIAEKLGGEEFSYLSLSHKIVNPEMPEMMKGNPLVEAYKSPEQMKEQAIREGTREVSQGIALSARTEQLVAEKLDLNLKPRGDLGDISGTARRGVDGKAPPGIELGGLFADKKKRRGSGGEGTDEGGDSASPYIPWWLAATKPKKFKGKARWWVPFLYFLGASAVGLALVYAFRAFMTR